MEQQSNPLFGVNLNSELVFYNDSACTLFGFSSSTEGFARQISQFMQFESSSLETVIMLNLRGESIKLLVRTKSIHRKIVEISTDQIRDLHGYVTGLLFRVCNVSDKNASTHPSRDRKEQVIE